MNKTIFKQYDSRWATLPYPKSPYLIRNCGCGECAIANIIIEMDKYKSQTPKTIQPYMKQFADPNGNGTYHSGIPTAMKHYGLTEVKECKTMPELWKEMEKGNRVCILLFGSKKGGSKGVIWTTSGHFIAGAAYKYENGKHYLYCKDSGTRDHDGWMSYEETMRNDVLKVWSGKLSNVSTPDTPKKGYSGAFPNPAIEEIVTVSNTAKIVSKAKALAWAKGTSKDKYAYKGGNPTNAYKSALNECYPDRKSWGEAPRKGCACDVYVGTVVRATGLDKDYPRGVTPLINTYTSKAFQKIVKKNVKPFDVSQDGDIIAYFKDKAHKHAHTLIRGDGVIYEAQLEMTYPHVNTSLSKIKTKMPVVVIMRAKPTTKKTVRNYLKKGDKGSEVTKWQKFLNWYFGKDVLATDGTFGDQTDKYSKQFQTDMGLSADGLVGQITIGKAKSVTK